MILIGMLDSAYVRRVGVTMHMLGIPFEHQGVSVFRSYDAFRKINPLVKAPTLVCDDGEQLIDSTLIIDYLETLAGKSLMPSDPGQRRRALQLIGIALAVCEKAVQILLERDKRPAEKQYEPWSARVREQMVAGLEALERALEAQPLASDGTIDQAGITVAITWRFTQMLVADMILPAAYPVLAAYAAKAEQLPAFIAVAPT